MPCSHRKNTPMLQNWKISVSLPWCFILNLVNSTNPSQGLSFFECDFLRFPNFGLPPSFLLSEPIKKDHLYSKVHLHCISDGPQKPASVLSLKVMGTKCLIAVCEKVKKNSMSMKCCFLSVKEREKMQLNLSTYISKAQAFSSEVSFFAPFPAAMHIVMSIFQRSSVHTVGSDRVVRFSV